MAKETLINFRRLIADLVVLLLIFQIIFCSATEQEKNFTWHRRKISNKSQKINSGEQNETSFYPQYYPESYLEPNPLKGHSHYPPLGHLYPYSLYSDGISTKNGNVIDLYDVLPANPNSYDKFRQPNNNGTATEVDFHVTILSLSFDNIHEESMTYEAEIFLTQKWIDPRLRVRAEKKGKDYEVLDVNWMEDFWKPDVFFKNAKSVQWHDMTVSNHFLWLYNDKTLLYMARLSLTLTCPMKYEKYPHDTQFCTIEMESLSQTTKDQVFKWGNTKPLVLDPNLELPQFNIVTSSAEDCTFEYSTGKFTCLKVVFELRRKLSYYIFHIYIPSAFIVALSWISFWIRSEATAVRITVCATSLLILATQNVIQSLVILPRTPCIKAIDVWMGFCTAFAILALLEFVLVNHFIGGEYQADNPFKDIYELDTNTDSQSQIQPFAVSTHTENLRNRSRKRNISMKLDKISRFAFPLAFLIFNIIYWSIVLI